MRTESGTPASGAKGAGSGMPWGNLFVAGSLVLGLPAYLYARADVPPDAVGLALVTVGAMLATARTSSPAASWVFRGLFFGLGIEILGVLTDDSEFSLVGAMLAGVAFAAINVAWEARNPTDPLR